MGQPGEQRSDRARNRTCESASKASLRRVRFIPGSSAESVVVRVGAPEIGAAIVR